MSGWEPRQHLQHTYTSPDIGDRPHPTASDYWTHDHARSQHQYDGRDQVQHQWYPLASEGHHEAEASGTWHQDDHHEPAAALSNYTTAPVFNSFQGYSSSTSDQTGNSTAVELVHNYTDEVGSLPTLDFIYPRSDAEIISALATNRSIITKLMHQIEDGEIGHALRPSRIIELYEAFSHSINSIDAKYCEQRPPALTRARKKYDKNVDIMKDCLHKLRKASKALASEKKKSKDQLTTTAHVLEMLGLAKNVLDMLSRCEEIFELLHQGGEKKKVERHRDRLNDEVIYTSRCERAALILEPVMSFLPDLHVM